MLTILLFLQSWEKTLLQLSIPGKGAHRYSTIHVHVHMYLYIRYPYVHVHVCTCILSFYMYGHFVIELHLHSSQHTCTCTMLGAQCSGGHLTTRTVLKTTCTVCTCLSNGRKGRKPQVLIHMQMHLIGDTIHL